MSTPSLSSDITREFSDTQQLFQHDPTLRPNAGLNNQIKLSDKMTKIAEDRFTGPTPVWLSSSCPCSSSSSSSSSPSPVPVDQIRVQAVRELAYNIITKEELEKAGGNHFEASNLMLREVGMTPEDLFYLEINYGITRDVIIRDGGLKKSLELEIRAIMQFIQCADTIRSYKPTRAIPTTTFSILQSLHEEIPKTLAGIKNIDLDLNMANIESDRLPSVLPTLPEVIFFKVKDYNISSIRCLSSFPNLIELELDLPQLSSFPKIFHLLQLRELRINNAKPPNIPAELSTLPQSTRVIWA